MTTRRGARVAEATGDEAIYSMRGIQEMLGLSRRDVLEFVEAGFVTPTRGPRNVYRFGFRDVVLLRTAQTLRDAQIPTRRIVRALKRLRDQLPVTVPLSGLRITAVGDDVAVREAGQDVALESGQLLFDFDVASAGAVLAFPSRVDEDAGDDSDALLAQAAAIEATDPEAAAGLYGRAIAIGPDDPNPYLALGALLYEHRRFDEALAIYDRAIARSADEAELHYNRAMVLEDLGRADEALDGYEMAIRLDATFADAHWNAARLYEQQRMPKMALQHFSAYRRLRR